MLFIGSMAQIIIELFLIILPFGDFNWTLRSLDISASNLFLYNLKSKVFVKQEIHSIHGNLLQRVLLNFVNR